MKILILSSIIFLLLFTNISLAFTVNNYQVNDNVYSFSEKKTSDLKYFEEIKINRNSKRMPLLEKSKYKIMLDKKQKKNWYRAFGNIFVTKDKEIIDYSTTRLYGYNDELDNSRIRVNSKIYIIKWLGEDIRYEGSLGRVDLLKNYKENKNDEFTISQRYADEHFEDNEDTFKRKSYCQDDCWKKIVCEYGDCKISNE